MGQEISVNRPRLAPHYPLEPWPCQSAGTAAIQLRIAAVRKRCWHQEDTPAYSKAGDTR